VAIDENVGERRARKVTLESCECLRKLLGNCCALDVRGKVLLLKKDVHDALSAKCVSLVDIGLLLSFCDEDIFDEESIFFCRRTATKATSVRMISVQQHTHNLT
jgi:hypothetical protein